MSLEEVIKENTIAVSALTKALEAVSRIGSPMLVKTEAATPSPKQAKAPSGAKVVSAPQQDVAETQTTPTTPSSPSTPASAAATATAATDGASAISYETVKQATLAYMAANGRDALFAVFAKFGVPSGGNAKSIDPTRYAEYLKAIDSNVA